MTGRQADRSGSDAASDARARAGGARRIRIVSALAQHAPSVLGAVLVFSCLVNLLMLAGPLYMLQIYNRVLASGSVNTLVALTVLVAALYAMLAFLEGVRSQLATRLGWRFQRAYADDIHRAAHASMLNGPAGPAKSAFNDLATLRNVVGGPVMLAVMDAPWTPLFIALIFMLHSALGWLSVAGVVVLTLLAVINEIVSRRRLAEASRVSFDVVREGEETLRHAETFEALGMSGRARARWLEASDESAMQSARAQDRVSTFTGLTKGVRLLFQSLVLGLGAYLVILGQLNAGVMIAASIIAGRSLAPIEMLVGQWRALVQARDARSRLNALLERDGQRMARMSLPALEGRVSVRTAAIAPPGERAPVVKGVSFDLAPGEALGIIGPSASGKSTLARALVGVWKPLAGEIRLDGAVASERDPDELGRQIGFMPQDTVFFDGTIAENIARLDPNARSEAVIDAAKAAGCHEMILGLTEGYDTVVGSRGRLLSAGQKQSIALARALYGEPNLVVLDEPNANLDAKGDAALAGAIRALKERGATVIVIAHRPSAIAHVDKLLMLNKGLMADFGPRDEVLARVTRNAGAPESGVAPFQHRSVKGGEGSR